MPALARTQRGEPLRVATWWAITHDILTAEVLFYLAVALCRTGTSDEELREPLTTARQHAPHRVPAWIREAATLVAVDPRVTAVVGILTEPLPIGESNE